MDSNLLSDLSRITIQIPTECIEQIAREVYERMRDQLPLRVDQDEKYGQTIARAMAKKFITINEVRLLFDCSRGYIDKLIEEAHAGETEHPIPYCDLNGLIVFEPEAVLVWARTPKQLKKKQKRQGPKKAPSRNIT